MSNKQHRGDGGIRARGREPSHQDPDYRSSSYRPGVIGRMWSVWVSEMDHDGANSTFLAIWGCWLGFERLGHPESDVPNDCRYARKE